MAVSAGVLAGVTLFQISSGQLSTCAQDTTQAFYCWGTNTNGQLGNTSTTSSDVPVAVQANCSRPADGGERNAGEHHRDDLVDGAGQPGHRDADRVHGHRHGRVQQLHLHDHRRGDLRDHRADERDHLLGHGGHANHQRKLGAEQPRSQRRPIGSLQLTSPTSLTWAATGTGLNQAAVDGNPGDQQFTATDNTATGAGWHITVSATTFTSGPKSLPNTGAVDFTGSVSSSLAGTAPTATCVASCTLPTDTTTYPVVMATAVSSPTAYTVYDTSAAPAKA